jgi:hypothetical protein
MTDDSRWDMGASGESSQGPGAQQPWFPPSGPSGGAVGGGPAGGYGQAGWYGQQGPPPYGGWPQQPQAPKPGVIPLRPLGVGEILDGAFTTIRRNPRATLGIAAILLTVSGIITAAATLALADSAGLSFPAVGQQPTQQQLNTDVNHILGAVLPLAALSTVLYFVVDLVLTGVLTVVIGRSVLGHTITAGEAWKIAGPRLPALLGVTLLVPLAFLAPWVAWGFVMVVLAVAHAPGPLLALFGVLGGIAAFAFSVVVLVRLRMAGPVVVLERLGPWTALKRSWRLVAHSFWRVLGITLLAVLIVGVTAAILQIPFTLVAAVAAGGGSASPLGFSALSAAGRVSLVGVTISTIGNIVAGSVTRPISAGVAILLYVDLRMRREGFDLVLQSASAQPGMTTGDELASVWRPGFPAAPYSGAGQGGAPPAW